MCLATLVWVYNRQNQTEFYRRLTSLLLLYCIGHTLILQFVFNLLFFINTFKASFYQILFIFMAIVNNKGGTYYNTFCSHISGLYGCRKGCNSREIGWINT